MRGSFGSASQRAASPRRYDRIASSSSSFNSVDGVLGCRQAVAELLGTAGADDRRRDSGVGQDPGPERVTSDQDRDAYLEDLAQTLVVRNNQLWRAG
jgi:hypothetical protein